MADLDRFIQEYRAGMVARVVQEHVRPSRRRLLALTAAFAPMIAFAALPVTVVAAIFLAWGVGSVTTPWLGAVVLVAAILGLGHLTARRAARAELAPAGPNRLRWLPFVATVPIVGESIAEMATGGRAPADPVIVLWVASVVWLIAFFPLATAPWGRTRRALWAVGPLVTSLAMVFLATQGLFWLRFKFAASDLDALARQVANGQPVANGTRTHGFTVRDTDLGPIYGNAGCDVAFWITGWHEDDTRYIAHCAGRPSGDFEHLEGDWWQKKDAQPPTNW